MCGRYALAMRPWQVRQMLENENMPVCEAPEDEGDGAPRSSYNFAPGYHGLVYRAEVPDWGAGPRRQAKKSATKADGADSSAPAEDSASAPSSSAPEQGGNSDGGDNDDVAPGQTKEVRYKLQSMKWGLIPFWTKRNPDYGGLMKTINCRDDSLAQSGGMWNTMKARKRCIVVAQGFYEWLNKNGGKDKIPHYIKRKDGQLMCMAGLWDMVKYENDDKKSYTYTIITTDSNKQLKFLHDRMPVIFDNGSQEIRTWLDPGRYEWSKELQGLLKPYDGELEIYPVSKDVGKVGNNSPSFIIPIDSKENKSNIANFFAKGAAAKGGVKVKNSVKEEPSELPMKEQQPEVEVKKETGFIEEGKATNTDTKVKEEPPSDVKLSGVKREAPHNPLEDEPPKKVAAPSSTTPKTASASKGRVNKTSATSNGTKSPSKTKASGSQKITKFFGNSA